MISQEELKILKNFASRIPPDDAGAHNNLAIVYYNKGLYDEEYYRQKYLKHNNDVRDYFKDRPNDFIEINVSKKEHFKKWFGFFYYVPYAYDSPIENNCRSSISRAIINKFVIFLVCLESRS